MPRPRTVLGKLLAEDGRPVEFEKLHPCPAPFHRRGARRRADAKSFTLAASGLAECRTCGFRCDAFSYLAAARRLPITNAREELALAGASEQWISKACQRHARNVAVLSAFADRSRQQPERRHILSSSAVPWYRRELERVGWTSRLTARTWPENCARSDCARRSCASGLAPSPPHRSRIPPRQRASGRATRRTAHRLSACPGHGVSPILRVAPRSRPGPRRGERPRDQGSGPRRAIQRNDSASIKGLRRFPAVRPVSAVNGSTPSSAKNAEMLTLSLENSWPRQVDAGYGVTSRARAHALAPSDSPSAPEKSCRARRSGDPQKTVSATQG